jgi:NADH:ubiquinone oxidoreductase subunit E
MSVDLKKTDAILKDCGPGRDRCVTILQKLQAVYGFLPAEALDRVVANSDITRAQIYGVATFYDQFRFTPVGRFLIRVCHGTACHVNGAKRITQAIESFLEITDGQTTPDGLFTLETVACLGCCSLSPVMMVNQTVHGRLTPKEAQSILKDYRRQALAQENPA